MRSLLTILLLVISLNSKAQENWAFKRDKQLHTLVGFAIGGGLSQLMISSDLGYDPVDIVVGPILPVGFIAMGKEWADASFISGVAEGSDIVYTMIGGAIGTIIVYSINKAVQDRRTKKKLKL